MFFSWLISLTIASQCGAGQTLTCTLSGTTLTVTGDGTFDSIEEYKKTAKTVVFEGKTNGLYIGTQVFADKSVVFDIIIKSNVKLHTANFQNNYGIKSVDLTQSGITDLPDHLFDSCIRIVDVKFPTNLASIGAYCFRFNSFTKLSFTNGVEIKEHAFSDLAPSITTISITGASKIHDYAFYNVLDYDLTLSPDVITTEKAFDQSTPRLTMTITKTLDKPEQIILTCTSFNLIISYETPFGVNDVFPKIQIDGSLTVSTTLNTKQSIKLPPTFGSLQHLSFFAVTSPQIEFTGPFFASAPTLVEINTKSLSGFNLLPLSAVKFVRVEYFEQPDINLGFTKIEFTDQFDSMTNLESLDIRSRIFTIKNTAFQKLNLKELYLLNFTTPESVTIEEGAIVDSIKRLEIGNLEFLNKVPLNKVEYLAVNGTGKIINELNNFPMLTALIAPSIELDNNALSKTPNINTISLEVDIVTYPEQVRNNIHLKNLTIRLNVEQKETNGPEIHKYLDNYDITNLEVLRINISRSFYFTKNPKNHQFKALKTLSFPCNTAFNTTYDPTPNLDFQDDKQLIDVRIFKEANIEHIEFLPSSDPNVMSKGEWDCKVKTVFEGHDIQSISLGEYIYSIGPSILEGFDKITITLSRYLYPMFINLEAFLKVKDLTIIADEVNYNYCFKDYVFYQGGSELWFGQPFSTILGCVPHPSAKNIVVEERPTTVETSYFSNNPYLESLTLPSTISSIAQEAFFDNPHLNMITCNSREVSIPNQVLPNCFFPQINYPTCYIGDQFIKDNTCEVPAPTPAPTPTPIPPSPTFAPTLEPTPIPDPTKAPEPVPGPVPDPTPGPTPENSGNPGDVATPTPSATPSATLPEGNENNQGGNLKDDDKIWGLSKPIIAGIGISIFVLLAATAFCCIFFVCKKKKEDNEEELKIDGQGQDDNDTVVAV